MAVHREISPLMEWAIHFKLPAAALFSTVVTIALLYLMQFLIDHGKEAITEVPTFRIVEFTRIKEDRHVETKKRRPEPPPAPDEPPPEIKQQAETVAIDNSWSLSYEAPLAQVNLNPGAAFTSDGEYLPIVKVQPVYPQQALQRGMFGWVLLEFTVDEQGRVINPVILDNCVQVYRVGLEECVDQPGRMFDRPALTAAKKFKYKPKIVDGVPIATVGVQHLIAFRLDEMQEI